MTALVYHTVEAANFSMVFDLLLRPGAAYYTREDSDPSGDCPQPFSHCYYSTGCHNVSAPYIDVLAVSDLVIIISSYLYKPGTVLVVPK